MSEKSLKTILGVLGVLVVAYVVVGLASGGPEAPAGTGALADALDGVDTADAEAVRILAGGDTVELRRGDDGWRVNGRVADSARIARLWEALQAAGDAEVVATNPDNHARLGVADDSARILEITAGSTTRLLLGDAGPYYPSVYVRLPERDEVYLVRGDLRRATSIDVDTWRDRTIARVDTAVVEEVHIVHDGTGFTLARSDEGWSVDGEPADSAAVRDLLGELANLTATGFAPDGTGFDPEGSVTALDAAGDTLVAVRLGRDDGGDDLARVPGREDVFRLSSWRVDRLTPARGDVASPGG